MKNLKIGLGQIQVIPAETRLNAEKIIREINKAQKEKYDILVFPELSISGYLIGDMWERPAFLKECEEWQRVIISATKKCLVIFGNVVTDWDLKGEDGRPRKYNCAIAAKDGKAVLNQGLNKPYFIKTLLPNYREFDETRHFYDMRKLSMEHRCPLEKLLDTAEINLNGTRLKIGITLCEDAWNQDYYSSPLSVLGRKGADILFNLSCSPFTLGKNEKRNRLFSYQAGNLGVPIIFVNSVGIQNNGKTVFTFDGCSTAYDNNGNIIFESGAFRQDTSFFTMPVNRRRHPATKVIAKNFDRPLSRHKKNDYLYRALSFGVKSFLSLFNLKKVVIGVSGGIDSAVTAAVYASILPVKNILLVNMPSQFNSATTINLSRRLAKNLGCFYLEVPIGASTVLTRKQIHNVSISDTEETFFKKLTLTQSDMENVQARDRSSRILAALASAFGGVFTCNANKAEIVVGYSTLYGDLSGYLALIGDLWKEDVYSLGRHLNRRIFKESVIPSGCFKIVPSAELSDSQDVNSGKGDPLCYPYHDKLFFTWIQNWLRCTPEEILGWYLQGVLASKLGCDSSVIERLFPTVRDFIADLERWWELYNGLAAAKRVQAPPVLAVSSRAFGFDHREHIGAPFYSKKYLCLKKAALKGI